MGDTARAAFPRLFWPIAVAAFPAFHSIVARPSQSADYLAPKKEHICPMKLHLLSAAPALLFASSLALAQANPPAPASPAPAAPVGTPVAATPDVSATAAFPAAALAVSPAPSPAPAEVLPSAPPESPLPTKLGIGKDGFWQPGATLQFWAFGANQAGDTSTTFRVRRAELRVKGEIIPKTFGFNVMIDPSRVLENNRANITVPGGTATVNNQGTVTILQDYFITFMSEYADVSVGQFKIPISLEGYGGSSKVIFPERAIVSRRFGDQRDLGIRIEKKLGKQFYYYAGLFNGEGQNRLDGNAQKDAALRLEVSPIEGITIGAVGYAGIHKRSTSATKDRIEADFKLDLSGVLLQAEYIHGWDGPTAVARKESAGVYAVLGYTIADKLQPLFRIGHFDSDVRRNLPGGSERSSTAPFTDEVTSYELGLNYFIRGNDAKLQASWSKFVFADEVNRGEVILSAQAAF